MLPSSKIKSVRLYGNTTAGVGCCFHGVISNHCCRLLSPPLLLLLLVQG
jgi:hypothetical protein